ncbi:MAG: hypothetical protein HXY38_15605, partial [Chloroflexi bacterium]|nr:hypothetical protein [Chloroflexota bacterium]
RRPHQQVVEDLYAARGELFDDLFTRAWSLLDEAARRVLLVATFFPASASSAALGASADVQGFAFDRAVERLTDLALLDVQQDDLNSEPRYAIHPLVRAFGETKVTEDSLFEFAARSRWISYYERLVSGVGYCWNDLERLSILDNEIESVFSVISRSYLAQQYDSVLHLAKGASYYLYVRGYWNNLLKTYQLEADAAKHLALDHTEATALAYYVQVTCRQGDIDQLHHYVDRLTEFQSALNIDDESRFEVMRALALYRKVKQSLAEGINGMRELVKYAEPLSQRLYSISCGWLANLLMEQGLLDEAQYYYGHALASASAINYQRGITTYRIKLAVIALAHGRIAEAKEELFNCGEDAQRNNDRETIARLSWTSRSSS